MFFKIIENNLITDVGNTYLYWQKKNRTLLGCKREKASYIKTDNGNVYESEWLRPVLDGAPRYRKVVAEIITEKEYNQLKQVLQKEESIPVPQEEPIVEEQYQEPKPAKLLDYASATALLFSLTEQYNELIKRNQFLEDCLLELSQELYK